MAQESFHHFDGIFWSFQDIGCGFFEPDNGARGVLRLNDVFTPLKFNMEPENQPLQKEIPIGNHHFEVPC